jgi:hypothetical protein
MADAANHIFLPWVRSGAAGALPDEATERLAADQPAAVSLTVRFEVNSSPVQQKLRLHGPGSITGIDRLQVIRVEPRHGSSDFEPNYFPAIEFDRPDFPWLFTPAKANAENCLRPWLCLVVVKKQDGVSLRPAASQPLPVLEIKKPAKPGDELPDLAEVHLWAHAQVTGAAKNELTFTLKSKPAQTLSRLMCPRRLDPLTAYIACVVPTFAVGSAAGLNKTAATNMLQPAWLSGTDAPAEIELPVYFSWEFQTSSGGDFEELVRRLKPREMPKEAGKRPIDIGDPGFDFDPPTPDANKVTLGMEGALRPVDSQSDKWEPAVRLPFQNALARILNTPWEIATTEVPDPDPIVGPPVYGCWHAAAHRVASENADSPPWLNELNLDPRNRAVAAIGTQVVQEKQEQLMASAWEQLGDIERINQRLRQAQLSRAVNTKYFTRTFSRLPEDSFLKMVAPAKSYIVLDEQMPNDGPKMRLAQKLDSSTVPQTAVSAPARRLMRPRSAMNKELSLAGVAGVGTLFKVFSTMAALSLPQQTRGAVTIDQVTDALPRMVNAQSLILNPGPPPFFEGVIASEWPFMLTTFRLPSLSSGFLSLRVPSPQTSPDFFEAVKAHHDYLTRLFTTMIFFPTLQRLPISTLEIKASVLLSLNPARTVRDATLDGVVFNRATMLTSDDLDPIMDAPEFPQPMYEALRDLSQDYFFPGLEHVPTNTAQVLKTNEKFIESFMVGLNAEMGRELLWRNYPTDQRGTYFQQFWDTESAGADAKLDLNKIHEWGNSVLGANMIGRADRLVLLIRGDITRRYPGVVIYAVKAVMKNGKRELATEHPLNVPPPLEAYPVFRGTLEPDVIFVGFDLSRDEVLEGDGWFFVLQQQPTEPRFGLDDDPFGPGDTGEIPPLVNWNDLNWAHAGSSLEELKKLSHLTIESLKLRPTNPLVKGTWGRNSAHMAYITKQLPVRVAIHATELLP